jgi:hypothetical protein
MSRSSSSEAQGSGPSVAPEDVYVVQAVGQGWSDLFLVQPEGSADEQIDSIEAALAAVRASVSEHREVSSLFYEGTLDESLADLAREEADTPIPLSD